MVQPTEQYVQVVSVLRCHQWCSIFRLMRLERAPTGHTSTHMPHEVQGVSRSDLPKGASMRLSTPRSTPAVAGVEQEGTSAQPLRPVTSTTHIRQAPNARRPGM